MISQQQGKSRLRMMNITNTKASPSQCNFVLSTSFDVTTYQLDLFKIMISSGITFEGAAVSMIPEFKLTMIDQLV